MSPEAAGALVHTVFEAAAYAAGSRLFFALRRRHGHATDHPEGGWVLVGAVLGAAAGSKLLDLWQYGSYVALHWRDPTVLFGGKTIVGGLLGGWIGVETAKRFIGLRRSTGDLLVLPLILGLGIGRLGCFFAGPADHTEGALTTVPWAVDLGDGPRHPTPLYEIAFLGLFAAFTRLRRPARDGDFFLLFMATYLLFRFIVDFWKAPFGPDPLPPAPDLLPLGITPIQAVALLGACYAAARMRRS
jgi:hypothetical protein